MNRTLTATVALAAALGLAGVAHAQTPAPNMPQPVPGASTAMPNSPAVANPSTMTSPSNVNTSAARPSGLNPPAASNPSSMDPSATAANPATNNNNSSFQGGSKQASMSQSDIQQAQQQLKSQGLYRGAVDGILGPQTEQALSQFQQQNGLPQTADLDQQTMSRLMGGSSQQGMQQQPMQPQAMPQQNQAIPGSAANPLPANQAR